MASIWKRKDRDDFTPEPEHQDKEPDKRSVFAGPPAGNQAGSPFKIDPSAAPSTAPDQRPRPVSAAPTPVPASNATPMTTFEPPPLRDVGTTVLGKDISFKGELRGSGSVKIDGYFEGSIVLDREVTIQRNGRVHAVIEADMIHVEGEIQGNVSARSKIIISSSGRMIGDIKAKAVVVAEGATFKGRVEMDLQDKKPAATVPAAPPPSASAPIPTPPSDKPPIHPTAAPQPQQRPVQRPRPLVSPGEDLSGFPTVNEAVPRPIPAPPPQRPPQNRSPFGSNEDSEGPFANT